MAGGAPTTEAGIRYQYNHRDQIKPAVPSEKVLSNPARTPDKQKTAAVPTQDNAGAGAETVTPKPAADTLPTPVVTCQGKENFVDPPMGCGDDASPDDDAPPGDDASPGDNAPLRGHSASPAARTSDRVEVRSDNEESVNLPTPLTTITHSVSRSGLSAASKTDRIEPGTADERAIDISSDLTSLDSDDSIFGTAQNVANDNPGNGRQDSPDETASDLFVPLETSDEYEDFDGGDDELDLDNFDDHRDAIDQSVYDKAVAEGLPADQAMLLQQQRDAEAEALAKQLHDIELNTAQRTRNLNACRVQCRQLLRYQELLKRAAQIDSKFAEDFAMPLLELIEHFTQIAFKTLDPGFDESNKTL